MLGSSCVAEQLAASQEGLGSMKFTIACVCLLCFINLFGFLLVISKHKMGKGVRKTGKLSSILFSVFISQ
jgi:ABC-type multidrug transport system permease subunit